MKICPRCQKTYADDNLNFCLEDGSVLTAAASGQILPETLVMNEPRITQPQPSPGTSTSGSPPNWQQQPQQYAMQPPKKSSKAWLWVLGILGILILLCGGGFVGFVFWAASQADKTANSVFSNSKFGSPTPYSNKTPTSTSTTGRDDVTTVDLNMFVKEFSVYGTTEMSGDELTMGSIRKGFYYVLVAPDKDEEDNPIDKYKTDDADTRVTVQNVNDASSSLGYGLIFHSNPQPLQQDYAFLIDTKRKKYEVVRHEPQKETVVKNWTSSNAIKGGTEENVLEVRDQSDKIEMYINGTMVTSIQNTHGYSGGVVGLYSGDGVKVVFKNLEIRR
ncbi:MAG: hypothetical protein IPL32_14745 [Chloracidobacterium sp.]|nr:hypothetical protein [Chloracidobacterium sp.]